MVSDFPHPQLQENAALYWKLPVYSLIWLALALQAPLEAEERGKVSLKLPWVVYLGGAGIKELEAGSKGHSASWKGLAGFSLTPSVPVLGLTPEPSSMSTEDFL